jgi:hypothetical protein
MPQYMLLMYMPDGPQPSPEQIKEEHPRWQALYGEMHQAGVIVSNSGLSPVDNATTVRVRDGQTLVSDGPFAETKEILGGYFLIDVADLDEALKWAEKIPSAERGSVEVRPVWNG